MAVSSNNTASLARTTNINQRTSDWSISIWFKENTFPTTDTYASAFDFTAGGNSVDRTFVGAQNGDESGYAHRDSLVGYIYDDYGALGESHGDIITGDGNPGGAAPDTTWTFIAVTHVANAAGVTWYFRKENVGSLSTFTTNDPTANANKFASQLATAHVFTDASAEQMADGSAAYCRVWTAALSSTELLAESASASAVRTSGLYSDLPMSSVAAAGTDTSGNGNNWTVTNTLTLASNPTIALPGGGGTVPPRRALMGVGR